MDERSTLAAGILLLLLITSVGPVFAQDGPEDGVSIDCGSDSDYYDPVTKINWVTDANFTRTGKNAQNLAVYDKSINSYQSTSLRYFDEGRGRDCYVLKVHPQFTYLVRPTFNYGDWNSPANVTSFGVYLNGNYWLNFVFDTNSFDYPITYWFEAVVYTTSPTLNVCLVRREGTPFISSLELRKMDSGMYLSVVGNHKYMGMFTRVNAGADRNVSEYLRFPDDEYDRIWSAPGSWDKLESINTTNQSPNSLKEKPPVKVMEDAWSTDSGGFRYSYSFDDVSAVGQVAIYSYFQEGADGSANSSGNIRGMQYYINGLLIDTFNLTSGQPYEVSSGILDVYDRNDVTIQVKKDNTSNLYPILNAIEIYWVQDWNGSSTDRNEVKSIERIKTLLNLDDWTGDPCVPFTYDWLGCEGSPANQNFVALNNQTISGVRGETIEVITRMDLSNTGLASIAHLNLSGFRNLTALDLSSNNFSGEVLDFVQDISIKSLSQLNAANNDLEGMFPLGQLYDIVEFPNLSIANFEGNPKINGTLDLTSWRAALKSFNKSKSGVNVLASTPPRTSTGPKPGFPTIYLRNTNITGIYPSLEDLTPDIETFLRSFQTTADSFMNYGILLGGNPWCKQKDFSSQPLSQQYLCRLYTDQDLPGLGDSQSKDGNVGAIIGGVSGALVFLSCFCFAAVWWLRNRLKKETSALKEIQDALTKRKVQPPFYKYADLQAATNDFSSANELGRGAFGTVYEGSLLDSRDGTVEQVAVKKLYPSKQALTEFLNETVLITGIKHRNLVQLKGCCIHKGDQRMLVYEYAENGNLAEALWDKRVKEETSTALDWQQRLNICVGIARGLSYLHEELQPRIIHRDIKPPNILMDKKFNAKIADFGTARYLPEGIEDEGSFTKHIAGTKGYFSPEYATNGQLTEKADVYSFGVVLLEIVSGRRCIDPHLPGEKQFLHDWARKLREQGKLLDLLDPTVRTTANNEEVIRVINLAFLCLDYYAEKRPRMPEAASMLQGLMDVTLYKPEPDTGPFNYSLRSDYAKLVMNQAEVRAQLDDSAVGSKHIQRQGYMKAPGWIRRVNWDGSLHWDVAILQLAKPQ